MVENVIISISCVVVVATLCIIMVRFLRKLDVIEKERWGEETKDDSNDGFFAVLLPFLKKKKKK